MASIDPTLARTIPALPAATTPLTGSELIPLSQNGITVQTPVSQIGGGTTTTINGLSGAVGLRAGTGINVDTSGQNITVTNTNPLPDITSTQVAYGTGAGITSDPTFIHDPTNLYTLVDYQDLPATPDPLRAVMIVGGLVAPFPDNPGGYGAGVMLKDTTTGDVALNAAVSTIGFPMGAYLEFRGSGSIVSGVSATAASGLQIRNNTTTWAWPSADGTTGQFLKTDGSGNLGWATGGGGSLPAGSAYQTLQLESDGTTALWLNTFQAASGVSTIYYDTCVLGDLSAVNSIEWGNRLLVDGSASTSVDWEGRVLMNGFDQILSWNTPATLTVPGANITVAAVPYVFPGSQGAASTVLTNDGSGNLSWSAGGGAGSTMQIDEVPASPGQTTFAMFSPTANVGAVQMTINGLTQSIGNYSVAWPFVTWGGSTLSGGEVVDLIYVY